MIKLFKKKRSSNTSNLILYASKSGNAKTVAQLTQEYYKKNGLQTQCASVANFSPEKLKNYTNLLFVVSTHGEGDPPPSAKKFFQFISGEKMQSLPGLRYTVCALGDSSYEKYCEAGKKIDKRLEELQAKPICPRMDCDTDFAEGAKQWIKKTYEILNGRKNTIEQQEAELVLPDKKQFTGKILQKNSLTAMGKNDTCYHLAIVVEESNFTFQPGDSIAVKPQNPEWLVDAIIEHTGFDPTEALANGLKLREALNNQVEITSLTTGTLHKFNECTSNPGSDDLLQDKNRLDEYLGCANILDLLTDFGPFDITPDELIHMLPATKPRYYSIASAPGKKGKSFDLMIKCITNNFKGRKHEGAGSAYLTKQLEPGEPFEFEIYSSPDFYLPTDAETPIIMIGTGTGIAPLRAFLQHRQSLGIRGKTWLIFGEKHSDCDFYYRDELMQYKENKILELLDTAFSRDTNRKLYVQDIIQQKKDTLLQWINSGAHIYVCGSKKMGTAVRDTMATIFKNSTNKAISNDFKQVGFKYLLDGPRYHEDTY